MSTLDTTPIHSPLQAADYVYDLLREVGPSFGLENIEFNSKLIRLYPAAVITPGRKDKVLHSTHFFRVLLEVGLTVYHARLDDSHRERSREDLRLCDEIEAAIETGSLDMGGRATFCFVSEIAPGTIARPKGEQVVGSRMIITVDSRELMSKGV